MAATAIQTKSRYSRIWAGAREAGLSSDAVHDLVSREFNKKSLKQLTDRQVEKLGSLLWDMGKGRTVQRSSTKRTDEGGREDNVQQRRKIYMLAQELGWSEDDVNRFCLSKYGVARQEWLPPDKCSEMIEALKAMGSRAGKKSAVQ